MFNFEQSISAWRQQMHSAGVNNPEILDELENHLREDVARRMQSGETEQQAFESAVQAIGEISVLQNEFKKIGGKKRAWLRKLKTALAEAFVPVPALSAFSPGAQRTLELAKLEAPRLQHNFIGTEHVLLGLLALEDSSIPNILKRLGINRAHLKQQIEDAVSNFASAETAGPLPYTPRVKKSLQLAATEAKLSNHASIGAEHIFLGLLREGDGVAARVLKNLGLNPETTRAEITKEMTRRQGDH
jgi:hypothetical protein